MQETKVTIQFGSITNLWKFRNAISINAFYINIAQYSITFATTELSEIGWAIEKYYGQIVHIEEEA